MQHRTMIWIGAIGLGLPALLFGLTALEIYFDHRRNPNGHRFSESEDNLHNLGVALWVYESKAGHFSAAASVSETTPAVDLHNWQTHLLPHVEQGPLYSRIDLTRPWDDPVNEPQLHGWVGVYENSTIATTTSPTGLALTHYSGSTHMFPAATPLRQADVRDGQSNTLFMGEINAGFPPWGQPRNVRDPAVGLHKGPTSFGGPWPNGWTQFTYVDARVGTLNPDIDPAVLRALATPAGGETVKRP